MSKNKKVRLRTLKASAIAFDYGSISCVVRNASVSEACLEGTSPLAIPDTLAPLLESDQIKRQRHVPG